MFASGTDSNETINTVICYLLWLRRSRLTLYPLKIFPPNLFRESPVLSWVILFIQQCRMLVTACRGTGSQTQILFGLTVLRKQLPECHSALDLLASMLWALNQQCWRKGKKN